MSKFLLIESDGYSIQTTQFNTEGEAHNKMSELFDSFDDPIDEEFSSLNVRDAILIFKKNVYPVSWKIVEVPEVSVTDALHCYYEMEKRFRRDDAKSHLLWDFANCDSWDDVTPEILSDFNDAWGVDLAELYKSEDYAEEAAASFLDKQDCNIAENTTWYAVIEEILQELPKKGLGIKFECPNGGDETDDCADCVYSAEYHFADGECVRRKEN